MLDTVRELLMKDPDPMVVSNCMAVIQQVCRLLPVLPTFIGLSECVSLIGWCFQ